MPRQQTTVDIHFPKAGIDLSNAFGKQVNRQIGGGEWARTTRSATNVRCYDPRTGRARGASRSGIRKYIADRVPTVVDDEFIIQHLNTMVTTEGTPVQISQLGRVVSTVIICEGEIYRLLPGGTTIDAATNSTGNTPAMAEDGIIFSACNSQKMWFADGENWVYYDPNTNVADNWVASAGSLPVDADTNAPTLIANWRGRICLSGLTGSPQNIYMSAIGDPTNFDYDPVSPSPAQAFALGTEGGGIFGLIGDAVTCLIPYSDDALVVGTDHEIHIFRGDPGDGGQIDLLTDAVGMCFGQPWCRDPMGNVYFLSNRLGLFVMQPNMPPQRISDGIEQELKGINTGETTCCMAWDDQFQGIYVFISPNAEPGEAHNYYYDARNKAWTRLKFKNPKHNPLVCVTFDGNLPTDRVILIGSWDGYVRAIDPDATDDDGYPIESEVWIGPILTKDLDDVTLKDMQPVLGENSGEITWSVHTGETAEAAFSAPAFDSGTWAPGRNPTEFVNCSGHAIYIKLTSTEPWSMESIRASVTLNGELRRRAAPLS